MSIRAIAWALEVRVGDRSAKLVLLSLADEANDFGLARPGVARLAFKTECSRSTVKRAIHHLEERGLLVKHSRGRRSDGLHLTNFYQLNMSPAQTDVQHPLQGNDDVAEQRKGGQSTMDLPLTNPPATRRDNGSKLDRGGVTALNRGRSTAVDRGGVTAVDHVPSCPAKSREERAPEGASPDRDEIVKALTEGCGLNWEGMTRRERRKAGIAASELIAASATPDEIRRRCARWPQVFDKAAKTPMGIANNWGQLAVDTAPRTVLTAEERARVERTQQLLAAGNHR